MIASRMIAAAAKAHQRVAGVDIRYVRGDQEIPLKAVPGTTRYELTDSDGRIISAQTRDYLIIADELLLDGAPVEPQREDKIIQSQADGEHTYKLLELPASKCWRWSDEQHVRYRVHTTEVTKP